MSSKTKAKAKAKAKPKPAATRPRVDTNGQEINLSECAREYMDCVMDPCNSEPSCLPMGLPFPSQKVKVWQKGILYTSSANSSGFLMFAPGLSLFNATPSMWYSSLTTFAGTAFATSGTGISSGNGNSTFVAANIGATATTSQYRLVSACIRVMYRGTEMNRGGDYLGVCTEYHTSLDTVTFTNVPTFSTVVRTAVKEGWFEVTYNGPSFPAEVGYLSGITSTDAAYNNPCMGVVCNSAAVSQPYDFEVYANFELIGYNAAGVTLSATDPVGAGAVVSGVKDAQRKDHSNSQRSPNFIKTALGAVGHSLAKGLTWVGKASPIVNAVGMAGKFVEGHAPRILGKIAGNIVHSLPRLAARTGQGLITAGAFI